MTVSEIILFLSHMVKDVIHVPPQRPLSNDEQYSALMHLHWCTCEHTVMPFSGPVVSHGGSHRRAVRGEATT
jgi:hypothetical protein